MGGAIIRAGLVMGWLLAAPSAPAEILRFKADLTRMTERPRGAERPIGLAQLSLDTDTRILSWRITYAGLSGPVTGGHFETPPEPPEALAMPGQLAPPFISPISASALMDNIQIGDLRAGLWAIVLATSRNPGGEIRGDIERAP
jgi:hypothetical protein